MAAQAMEAEGSCITAQKHWEAAGKEPMPPLGLRRPPVPAPRPRTWAPGGTDGGEPRPADHPPGSMVAGGEAFGPTAAAAAPQDQGCLHGQTVCRPAARPAAPVPGPYAAAAAAAHPALPQLHAAAGGPFQLQASTSAPCGGGSFHALAAAAAAAHQDACGGPGPTWSSLPSGPCFPAPAFSAAPLAAAAAGAPAPAVQLLLQQQQAWAQQQQQRFHAAAGGAGVAPGVLEEERHPFLPPAAGRHGQQPLPPAAARRSRIRRPNARRSLADLFDLAATLQEQDQAAAAAEEMAGTGITAVGSQESGVGGEEDAMDTSEPYPSSEAPCTVVSHRLQLEAGGDYDAPGPSRRVAAAAVAAMAAEAAAPLEPLLPLQHLLMSERAQQLTAIEVKAVIYRVCADLAARHVAGAGGGGGGCHVSISSIVLAPSGDLATTRLLPAGACSGGPERRQSPANAGFPSAAGAGACCALGFGARWAGRGQAHDWADLAAGTAAYVSPEVARCSCPSVAESPAADMWSLGVVLFVLLSGGYIPFGHRGLVATCVPNMPGPTEKVDKLQEWLEAHLYHKVNVIQQISKQQAEAPPAAEMRVVGFDSLSCDLLLSLLKADPAQRLTAGQVLRHPWLAEVAGLVPGPQGALTAVSSGGGRAATPSHPIPTAGHPGSSSGGRAAAAAGGGGAAARGSGASGHGGLLRRHSSCLLGLAEASASGCFSPSTPTGGIDAMQRGASAVSLTPTDSEGSDCFMGSFSDLLLLSGAASFEAGGPFSPIEEGPSPPLSQHQHPQPFLHPAKQQQQAQQVQQAHQWEQHRGQAAAPPPPPLFVQPQQRAAPPPLPPLFVQQAQRAQQVQHAQQAAAMSVDRRPVSKRHYHQLQQAQQAQQAQQQGEQHQTGASTLGPARGSHSAPQPLQLLAIAAEAGQQAQHGAPNMW